MCDKFAHPQEHFWLRIQLLVQCTYTAADRCHGWDGTAVPSQLLDESQSLIGSGCWSQTSHLVGPGFNPWSLWGLKWNNWRWNGVSSWLLPFLPVCAISPALYNNLRLHSTLVRRTSGRSLTHRYLFEKGKCFGLEGLIWIYILSIHQQLQFLLNVEKFNFTLEYT